MHEKRNRRNGGELPLRVKRTLILLRFARRRRADQYMRRAWAAIGWRQLQQELARSMEFGRNFALVGITLPEQSDGRASAARLETELRSNVRRVDFVWRDKRRVYVLLPEGDGRMAEGLKARLGREQPDLLDGFRWASAVGPEQGPTAGDMLRALSAESSD
jgi:hypothetical protein